jgi:hypothetical protein
MIRKTDHRAQGSAAPGAPAGWRQRGLNRIREFPMKPAALKLAPIPTTEPSRRARSTRPADDQSMLCPARSPSPCREKTNPALTDVPPLPPEEGRVKGPSSLATKRTRRSPMFNQAQDRSPAARRAKRTQRSPMFKHAQDRSPSGRCAKRTRRSSMFNQARDCSPATYEANPAPPGSGLRHAGPCIPIHRRTKRTRRPRSPTPSETCGEIPAAFRAPLAARRLAAGGCRATFFLASHPPAR